MRMRSPPAQRETPGSQNIALQRFLPLSLSLSCSLLAHLHSLLSQLSFPASEYCHLPCQPTLVRMAAHMLLAGALFVAALVTAVVGTSMQTDWNDLPREWLYATRGNPPAAD